MKLQVTMLDTMPTLISLNYEGEHRPHGRRQVTIELTPEQELQLRPRHVGKMRGQDVYEKFGQVFLEE